jgi:hypothetical protein
LAWTDARLDVTSLSEASALCSTRTKRCFYPDHPFILFNPVSIPAAMNAQRLTTGELLDTIERWSLVRNGHGLVAADRLRWVLRDLRAFFWRGSS